MRLAALLALVLVAGCSSARRLPPVEQLRHSGVTPRGIAWAAESLPPVVDLEGHIDAVATDTTWMVVFVAAPFLAGADQAVEPDTYDGLANPNTRRIYVSAPDSLRLLRHEYHHVTLFNQLGHVDPQHRDQSWDAGGFR